MSRVWDILGGEIVAIEGASVVVHIYGRGAIHLIFSPSQIGEHEEDEFIFVKKGEKPYDILPCDCTFNRKRLRFVRIPIKTLQGL